MQAGEGTIPPTIIAAFVLMMFSVTDAPLPISGAVEEVPVIDQLHLSIAPAEKIAVLGKSGTGKSTLLKLLSCMVRPVKGKVMLDDMDIGAHVLSEKVSVLNQQPHLFHTTIAHNVRIEGSHKQRKQKLKKL